MKLRSWAAWLGLPTVILGVAACAALEGSKQHETVQKYTFRGETVKALLAQATASSDITFYVEGGKAYVQVDANAPMDEAHPCPPFDDCP